MAEQIPDGATVWIKNAEKNSPEAFVKATVVKFTQGRGYTVKRFKQIVANIRERCAAPRPAPEPSPEPSPSALTLALALARTLTSPSPSP